jgi:hypothetical protein
LVFFAMPKSTGLEHTMTNLITTRNDSLQNRQGTKVADVLNNSKQSSDAVLDLFICGGRQRTHHERTPLAEAVSEREAQPHVEDLFSSEHPHSTKLSRQATGVVARLGMKHRGWKQADTKGSFWAFEHRWPHLRDRAEGRNHGLQGK